MLSIKGRSYVNSHFSLSDTLSSWEAGHYLQRVHAIERQCKTLSTKGRLKDNSQFSLSGILRSWEAGHYFRRMHDIHGQTKRKQSINDQL